MLLKIQERNTKILHDKINQVSDPSPYGYPLDEEGEYTPVKPSDMCLKDYLKQREAKKPRN